MSDSREARAVTIEKALRAIVDDAAGSELDGDYAGCVAVSDALISQAIDALSAQPPQEEQGTPEPFMDTSVLRAQRKAFDSPTQANLEALIAAVRAGRIPPALLDQVMNALESDDEGPRRIAFEAVQAYFDPPAWGRGSIPSPPGPK